MMQLYPAGADTSLEFGKIKNLLLAHCRSDAARERVEAMRFMTRVEIIQKALDQTGEYHNILQGADYFPNDFTHNVQKELKLLSINNAVLMGDQLLSIRNLALTIRDILLWFKNHNGIFPALWQLAEPMVYEKLIAETVGKVIDDDGNVRDNASKELMNIRASLSQRRQELRRMFESILRKLNKQGYLADISEGYLNGRRTVAITAEHKRIVKGILHGESDSAKTVFIEPEETIAINNEIFSLEREEGREIHRILAATTATLAQWQPLLDAYYRLCGVYDFIRAKAFLAKDLDADKPILSAHPGVNLLRAFHPLLYLHNKAAGKKIEPLTITLNRDNRILIISGPNAGGKTVSMKTVGLLQLMTQAGLLIPASPQSEVGVYKQLFIHIGDTQSIEHELSTYSAHLRDMKYFMDFANGKTLFFIDELGSGSDPNLGGAFAEAIVEELAEKRAMGIITTHYLNLKVMAGKVKGIYNGAMAFDEERLEPLYKLNVGKPGSSYTFAIAQRSGLAQSTIERARALTERGHFKLDKVLHQTEQQSVRLGQKEKSLDDLIQENQALREKYEKVMDKERFRQQQALLKLQNQIKAEEIEYLRETERKFKQIIQEWKRADNKQEVIEAAEKVLFKKKAIAANHSASRKADKTYVLAGGKPKVGDLVRNLANHQVGTLTEFRDKKAIVKIGRLPFTVDMEDWVVVRKREEGKK